MIYVAMYLIAVVLANLSVAHFGADSTIFNAFVFIAFDLTARDKLHEAWHKRGLIWKMALLISVGSLISAFLNKSAAQIAFASCAAFMAAGIVDSVAYALLFNRSKLMRVNGSNLLSALVDSLVFPVLAFGLPVMWHIVLGQFAAKVIGGLVWYFVLNQQSEESTNDL